MGWLWIPHILRMGEVKAEEGSWFQAELYGDREIRWFQEEEIEWLTREA